MDNYFAHFQKKQSSGLGRIKDKVLSLPLEEKLISIGLILTLIGCFLPWARFPGVDNTQPITYNGFQGVTYLIGYTMLLCSLVGISYMLAKFFGVKKVEQIQDKMLGFFFMASIQVAFLSVVTFSIYNAFYQVKYSATYVEFGVYVCLTGGLITLVGTYFQAAESKRSAQKKKSYHHLQAVEDEASRVLDQYGEDRETVGLYDPHPNQTTLLESAPEEQPVHTYTQH